MSPKVHILGGGPAGLTAAYALKFKSTTPDAFDVTIVESSFRPGGKCASHRAGPDQRIEEHGIHLFFGFYENAVAMLQDCQNEAGGPCGGKNVQIDGDVFTRSSASVLMERTKSGYQKWELNHSAGSGFPGVGIPALDNFATVMQWLVDQAANAFTWAFPPIGLTAAMTFQSQLARAMMASATTLAAQPGLPLIKASSIPLRLALQFVRLVAACALKPQLETNFDARKAWIMLDLSISLAIGLLEDDLLPEGNSADLYKDFLRRLRTIEHLDFRQWLKKHGCSDEAAFSAIIGAPYSGVFVPRSGGFGAGTALNGLYRMFFTSRGAPYLKFAGGTGEVIISPIVKALEKKAGFAIKYRAQVVRIQVEKTSAGTLRVTEYDVVTPGNNPPTTPTKRWPPGGTTRHCTWPETDPAGAAGLLTSNPPKLETVTVGPNDQVVLAIPPQVSTKLIKGNLPSALSTHLSNVSTTATAAMQLWLKDGLPAPHAGAVTSAFEPPLDTFVDMEQLKKEEGGQAAAIAYFCGPMDDGTPKQQQAAMDKWIADELDKLVPKAVRAGKLDGIAMEDTPYTRINTAGWERYTLTPPGERNRRLRADQSGVENLTLAGDWVDTSLGFGCFESTAMAGLAAGRHIMRQQVPKQDFEIIGDPEP